MTRRANTTNHGFNHYGPSADGGIGGSDPSLLNVDATENVGKMQGVRSRNLFGNETADLILTATGDGGSVWARNLGSGFETYRDCVLAHNPVAYWPMDETTGDITDIVGGEVLTVTSSGGFPVYGDPGPFVTPTAIRMGGTEGTGIFGGNAMFKKNVISTDIANCFTGSFTVEFWAYIIAYSAVDARRIFQYWVESGSGAFVIQVTTTGEIQASKAGASVFSASSMPLNAWTHVRVTFDGTDLKLWIDTVEVDSVAAPSAISGGPFIIGNREDSTDFWRPFSGRLSDFAVYDTDLLEFCELVTPAGPGPTGADAGMVLTADGAGSSDWSFPTTKVDGARYDEILPGANMTATDNTDGTVTLQPFVGVFLNGA